MHCSPNNIEPLPATSCDARETVIITATPPDSLQLDSFALDTIAVNGDTLSLEVTHGGGCKEHTYALYMSPGVFLESFPVQANLYLQHNANGDACKALLRKKVCVNVRPIAALYEKFYQRRDPIRINVHGHLPARPGEKLSVLYQP